MSESLFKRGLQTTIDNQELENGKFYVSIDQARLFMDLENERIEISDIVKGLTYNEIINLSSPLPKLYISTDTHQLMAYDFVRERWDSYNGEGQVPPAVIEELQEEIDELKSTVNAYQDQINELNETVSRYERVIEIIEHEYGLSGDNEEG